MEKAILEWVVVESVIISCSSAGEIPEDVWGKFITTISSQPIITKILGLSVGNTTISSVQRKAASELAKKRHLLIVSVTDERVVRGILTALSWLGINIKTFSWKDLKEAVAALELRPGVDAKVLSTSLELQHRVGKLVSGT